MKENIIDHEEATKILARWQDERRLVEVRLWFNQGIVQTHSGYVAVEPESRIVVANVESRDRYFTTVFFATDFDEAKAIESENAITFAVSQPTPATIRAITIACRQNID